MKIFFKQIYEVKWASTSQHRFYPLENWTKKMKNIKIKLTLFISMFANHFVDRWLTSAISILIKLSWSWSFRWNTSVNLQTFSVSLFGQRANSPTIHGIKKMFKKSQAFALTKCGCQVQNGRGKIAQTQCSIFSHVFQHDYWHYFRAELETNIIESVSQAFGTQNAGFFFWVYFEHTLPCF